MFTQDTADANYMLLTVVVCGHNCSNATLHVTSSIWAACCVRLCTTTQCVWTLNAAGGFLRHVARFSSANCLEFEPYCYASANSMQQRHYVFSSSFIWPSVQPYCPSVNTFCVTHFFTLWRD